MASSPPLKIRNINSQRKYFNTNNISDQETAKIFWQNKRISSDDFSVATPDETAGKDTEFSLVVSLRNKQSIFTTPFALF